MVCCYEQNSLLVDRLFPEVELVCLEVSILAFPARSEMSLLVIGRYGGFVCNIFTKQRS